MARMRAEKDTRQCLSRCRWTPRKMCTADW